MLLFSLLKTVSRPMREKPFFICLNMSFEACPKRECHSIYMDHLDFGNLDFKVSLIKTFDSDWTDKTELIYIVNRKQHTFCFVSTR